MTMARLRSILCVTLHCIIILETLCTDDTEYNDIDFYQNLPLHYEESAKRHFQRPEQDDFYILTGFEDAESQNDVYLDSNDFPITVFNNRNAFKADNVRSQQMDWYKLPERVYRYTKHRIPGYDYDEIDYIGTKNTQNCDDKSMWTHCVCQFTCSEPDIVDCYTPCKSGCECKEDYVFDEKTQQCLLPEQCSFVQENVDYKK